MKKLFFSFFFIIIIIKNIPGSFTTNLGPIQIITSNGLNTFTAGTIKLFGQIYIGLSTSDNIKIKGNQITYPDTGNTAILMIQNDGSIITSNTTNQSFTCNSITCGNLNAATNQGENVTLGNSSGSITINSANITIPSSGSTQLYINSDGNIMTLPSSKRYKTHIQKLKIPNNALDGLEAVSFSYTDDNNNLAYGFIAEDIKDIPILSNTITLAKNGQISGINYQEIFVITTAYLINSQKELNQIIFEFKKKIATQDNNLIEIIERIQKIEENIKLLTQSIEKFTAQ